MKMWLTAACAILLAIGTPVSAHRLDEYLQATTISVEHGNIHAQMRLTPGVAVLPTVLAAIDTNGDGVLSAAEQRAYADRVLRDLSLTVDGDRLPLRLISWKFPKVTEMKEGLGEIQLEFNADVPHSGRNRRLVFENHHQSRIAVYLVNCLVPRDPDIQVTAQRRNYQQSHYELDYVQAGVLPSSYPSAAGRSGAWRRVGMAAALLLLAPFAWLWWRARVGKATIAQKDGLSTHEMVSPEGRSI
jgi:hypothetical protein